MNPTLHPSIVRLALYAAAVILVPLAAAQTAPSSAESPTPDQDQPVLLNEFQVNASGDEGYKAANAISGSRYNTPLIDLPKPVDVITSEFIADIGARDMNDILKYMPSLSNNGTATPDDVTGTNYYNRGFQAFTTYRDGYDSYGIQDVLFTDRLEIIEGPSSTFSGVIEPGGTINVISKKPSYTPYGFVETHYGSWSQLRTDFLYSGPVDPDKKLRLLVGAAYEDYGSQYDFAGRVRRVAGGSIAYNPTKNTLISFSMQYVDTHGIMANPAIYFNPTKTGYYINIPLSFNRAGPSARSTVVFNQGNLDLTQQINDHLAFHSGFYYRTEGLDRTTMGGSTGASVNATTGAITVQRVPTYELSSNTNYIQQDSLLGEYEFWGLKDKIFLGFEDLRIDNQKDWQLRLPTSPANINVFDQNAADYVLPPTSAYTTTFSNTDLNETLLGYTESNMLQMFGERLLLFQAFRENSFFQTNINIMTPSKSGVTSEDADVSSYGASYRVFPRETVFVSYSESFDPQTGKEADGTLFPPLTGKGYDAGTKMDIIDGRLSGSLVVYQVTENNLSSPDPVNPGFNLPTGEVRSKGIELNAVFHPLSGWQIVAGYAYCKALTIASPGAPQNVGLAPPNVARNNASMYNRYSFDDGAFKGLSAGVGVVYVGRRRGNSSLPAIPAFRSPDYTVFDGNLAYTRKMFGRVTEFAFTIRNALNKYYYASYTALGEPRNFMGSVKVNF